MNDASVRWCECDAQCYVTGTQLFMWGDFVWNSSAACCAMCNVCGADFLAQFMVTVSTYLW
jgi:hypothetical protein